MHITISGESALMTCARSRAGLSGCAFARSFSCVMAGGDLYSACRQAGGEEEEGVCQEGAALL